MNILDQWKVEAGTNLRDLQVSHNETKERLLALIDIVRKKDEIMGKVRDYLSEPQQLSEIAQRRWELGEAIALTEKLL